MIKLLNSRQRRVPKDIEIPDNAEYPKILKFQTTPGIPKDIEIPDNAGYPKILKLQTKPSTKANSIQDIAWYEICY